MSAKWLLELNIGVWAADWEGDPGRTLVEDNAKRFPSKKAAFKALYSAREYRPFKCAEVYKAKKPHQASNEKDEKL